jgi:glutamate/tyrosine decarboxylase-like PLP-dependent enzyme
MVHGKSARTIEGSRPGSSVAAFWVALKTLGKDGYNGIIGRCMSLTRFLGKLLSDNGFQVPHEIDLNTLCFSLYKDHESRRKLNKLTSDLYSRVIADGRYLLGKVEDIPGIEVRDKPWQQDSQKVGLTGIKVWIMNPYTSEKDLEALVDELNRKREELAFN